MMFSHSIVCGVLISLANAARLTNSAQDFTGVTAGKPFTVTWSDASGPVTLLLKSGPSTNLQTVSTIASGQTGSSYVWTPDSSLPSGTYAIEIDDASGPNYSVQFPITGSTTSSTITYSPSATSTYFTTGYSSGYSSYIPSASSNMTSVYTSSAVYRTSTYASVYPTSMANSTSTQVPATSTSPITVPSNTNTAPGFTSSIALITVVLLASIILN